MYTYGFIAWCTLVFLFFSELIIVSLISKKPGIEILIIGILILLPIFRSLVAEIMKDFRFNPIFSGRKISFFYIGIVLLTFFLYTSSMEISTILLLLFLVTTLFLRADARVSFLIALTCLTFCALLLILEYKEDAETFAIYTYYFLVIGVVTEIFTSLFDKKSIDEITI